MLKAKKKKDKPIASIFEDELSFLIPKGWEWTSVANLTLLITDGTHHTPKYQENGVPFISVKDIDGFTVSFDDCKYISQKEHEVINGRCNPERDDILLCRIGTLGRPTIVDTDKAFSLFVSVGLLKLPKSVKFSRYFQLALSSPLMYLQYAKIMAGGSHTNKLNLGDIPRLSVPIPPLAEQHRIVAKVDELMALCDQLENQHNNAAEAHDKLVTHLLGTLTQSQNAEEFKTNWQRISEHFDTLFTTEASIDALKQTLLQLAVMGKLVPQDPNDEPASELLKRILKERDRQIDQEGSKTIASDKINESEMYITTPDSWVYCRLGNIARFIDYRGKTPSKISSGVPLITAKNVRFGYISREPEEHVSPAEYESWMTRGFPRVGDMLFTTEAPLGNIAIINIAEKFALAQRVICFKLHDQAIGAYLKIAIMSDQVQQQLINAATGMTATGIKASKLKEIPVPIPTLAEQHRIVAKVDELMVICDQLKAGITSGNQLQQKIADVLVEQTTA